jgi:hypothetical protein
LGSRALWAASAGNNAEQRSQIPMSDGFGVDADRGIDDQNRTFGGR